MRWLEFAVQMKMSHCINGIFGIQIAREPARKTARSWIMALPMAMVGCPVWKAFITLMRLVGTSFSATRVPIWWRKTLDPSGSKLGSSATWRRTLLKIGYISDHRHGVCARGKCRGGSLGPWGTAFQPEPRLEKALASVVLKQSRISDIAKQHLHLFLSRDLLHFWQ